MPRKGADQDQDKMTRHFPSRETGGHQARIWRALRTTSTNRTARGAMFPLATALWAAGVPFRRIVLGFGEVDFVVVGDRPASEDDLSCRLSTGRSDCQSMPCCFLSLAKTSRRASRSSFDLTIFSG